MSTFISKIPRFGDRGNHVELLQKKLNCLSFNIENIDGIFGVRTKESIKKFQNSIGAPPSGELNLEILQNLEFEVGFDATNIYDAILSIVDKSEIEKTNWANRGKAPYGYYYGMAIMYAKLYSRLKADDYIAKEIAKPLSAYERFDALTKYNDVFESFHKSNDSEANRIQNLFVLMFGLGMMESSGRHCCGWDRGKLNGWNGKAKPIQPTSINSEAGLFQTSYDIMDYVSADKRAILKSITNNYTTGTDSLYNYFSKGSVCSDLNSENYGDGIGKEFQRLSKESPAFSVELTAVALRNISGHWNPVIKKGDPVKGLEIKQECMNLLISIQNYLDTHELIPVTKITEPATPSTIATSLENRTQKIADLLNKAEVIGQKEALEKLFAQNKNSKANFWVTVDFNKPSSEERLFIFDLRNSNYKSYIVTHGKNSGELYASSFSNEIDSYKSSLGIFKAGAEYEGKHGRSLFLDGLDPTNDNAYKRAIVIHKADYATGNYRGEGGAGRSWGCFAVHPSVINEVVDCLIDGSYINAWHS